MLITALLTARCDDLVEPVAVTPGDFRPAIVTDLAFNVNEDGSITLDVEAEDPNGEALTLALTTPPLHGAAVLETNGEQTPAAAKALPSSQDTTDVVPEEPLRTKRTQQEDRTEKHNETTPAPVPPRTEAEPAANEAPTNTPTTENAGIRASVHVIRGTQQTIATAHTAVVGRIRYTPETDFNGVDRFGFSVRNTSGFTAEAEVTVTIDAEPDTPTVAQSLDDINLSPGQRITLNLRTENIFVDADGDALVYRAESRDPAIATAEVANEEVLTVQALNAPNQATLIDVIATDPGGLSATNSFTVTVEASDNQPPRVENPIADQAIIVGETFSVALNTVFADDNPLAFTATSGNPDVAQVEIIPPDTLRVSMLSTGLATITVTATDGIATAQTTFLVFLNPGVNAADDAAQTDADIPVVIDVLENDRDSNNGSLTVAGFLQFPTNGTVEIIDNGQRVRYTPTTFFFGLDRFIYVASNQRGDLDQAAVTVTVLEVNRPPEIINLLGATSGFVGNTFTFSATATDPNEGDVLTYSWDFGDGSPPQSGEDLTMVSHVYSQAGSFTLTLTVTDAEGAADTATLNVTAQEANQPPEITRFSENATGHVGDTFIFSATATDPEGDVLTYTWDFGDGGPLQSGEDLTTVSHVYSQAGSFTLTLTVTDVEGAVDTATLTVTVLVEMKPAAVPDLYRLTEGGTLVIDAANGVLANDQDPEGNGLTAIRLSNVSHGLLTFNTDGSFIYTHDGSETAIDAFRYRASDGVDETNEVTVTLLIAPINDPPVAVDDSYTMDQNTTLTLGTSLGVLANDFDVDDDKDELVAILATGTTNGAITLNTPGSFTYIPNNNFFGTDTFTYRVRDGFDESNEATVTLRVNQAGNTPPDVTHPGNQNDLEGQPITPLQIEATDPDPPLVYTTATLPPGLSLDFNTGLISGTPARDAAGPTGTRTYAVTIFVTDRRGGQTSVTFNWSLSNPAPTVTNPGDQTTAEGDSPTLQIQAADDDPVTYAATNLPDGLSIDSNSGMIAGTVDANAAGPSGQATYAVTITISDAQARTTAVQFDWTITNPAPFVTDPGTQSHSGGETVFLQIQATDDDPVTYTASGLPPGLTIGTNTGAISGTLALDAGSSTPYPVTITVTDNQTGSTAILFDWSVDTPSPTLGSVSPTSAAQGATLDVTLTGSNFIDGISSVTLSGSGITINTTTINSDTEIVVNITIDAAALTGDRDVTVTNTGPGGGTSAVQTFTVTT